MSHGRAVFRNTGMLGAARIIERIGGLVLTLLITRHLGAAALGIYATVTAYFFLIQQSGESGATNLLIRELSKDRNRTSSYVAHTSVMALAFSGVVMCIAWLVIPHLGYSTELQHSLELIVLAVAPGTLNTIQEAVFIARGRVEFETVTTLASSTRLVIGAWVLVERGHGVVAIVLLFVILEYAVTIVYFLLINRYIVRLRFEFRRSIAAEILREMKAFAGSSVLAGFVSRPEIVVLSLIAPETQVGYYTGALKIVDLFQFLPSVYMTNVFTVLSRSFHARDGRAQELQDAAMRHLLAFGIPVTVGLAAASDQIISTFYGDDFGNAVTLLRILSINVVLYCATAVLWRVLAARGEQGRVFRIQSVTASARLTVGTVLIWVLWALGAALNFVATLTLHAVLLARGVGRDGTSVGLLRLSWRFALAAGVMGIVVLGLTRVVDLWAVVLIAMGVYCALLVVFRALTPAEIALFRRMLPSTRPQRT